MTRKITPEDEARMTEFYNSGMEDREISVNMGWGDSHAMLCRVYQWRKRNNRQQNPPKDGKPRKIRVIEKNPDPVGAAMKRITEITRIAREMNLSYGEYQARIYELRCGGWVHGHG